MNVLLLLVSLVMGARHAMAPDHLAAVGTFTEKTEATKSQGLWYALRIAAGHSAGMLAVAAVIMGLLVALSPAWIAWTTWGSGVWLLLMALWILWDLARDLWNSKRSFKKESPQPKSKASSSRWVQLLKKPATAWAIGLLFGIAVSPGDLAIFTIMAKNHAGPLAALGYLGAFLAAMFAGLAVVGTGLGWANTRMFLRRAFQGMSGLAGLGVALALLTGNLH